MRPPVIHLWNRPEYWFPVTRPTRENGWYFVRHPDGGYSWMWGAPGMNAACGPGRGIRVQDSEWRRVTCRRCLELRAAYGKIPTERELAQRAFQARQGDFEVTVLEVLQTGPQTEAQLLNHPSICEALEATKPHLRGRVLHRTLARLRKTREVRQTQNKFTIALDTSRQAA